MLEHLSSQPSVENDVAESRTTLSRKTCLSQKLCSEIEEPQELTISSLLMLSSGSRRGKCTLEAQSSLWEWWGWRLEPIHLVCSVRLSQTHRGIVTATGHHGLNFCSSSCPAASCALCEQPKGSVLLATSSHVWISGLRCKPQLF